MITLGSFEFGGVATALALAGGMVHKLIGPAVEEGGAIMIKALLQYGEQKMSQAAGSMTAPVTVTSNPVQEAANAAEQFAPVVGAAVEALAPSTAPVVQKVVTGIETAAPVAAGVQAAVAGATTEAEKIEAGLASFLGFAGPILSAVEPSYAKLINGIGTGLATILAAVKDHQTAA